MATQNKIQPIDSYVTDERYEATVAELNGCIQRARLELSLMNTAGGYPEERAAYYAELIRNHQAALRGFVKTQNISLRLYQLIEGSAEAYEQLLTAFCPPGTERFNRDTELVKVRDLFRLIPSGYDYVIREPEQITVPVSPVVKPWRRNHTDLRRYRLINEGVIKTFVFGYAPENHTFFYDLSYGLR